MGGVGGNRKDVGIAPRNKIKIDEETVGGSPDVGENAVVDVALFEVVFETDDGAARKKLRGVFAGFMAKTLHGLSRIFGLGCVDSE